MQKKLEIACFNLQSAIIAANSGADRIELCENYEVGGITPSSHLIEEVLKHVSIPIFVMIRPRSGNFIYSQSEIEAMIKQIEFCKNKNMKGVVFGVLTQENKVNLQVCKQLVELAKPMQCTFHRAFDEIENSTAALEELIQCGFSRILTSGRKKSAEEGKEMLADLVSKAGNRIIIIPGGGIRSGNINELIRVTKANEFHSAALLANSNTANPDEIIRLKQQLVI